MDRSAAAPAVTTVHLRDLPAATLAELGLTGDSAALVERLVNRTYLFTLDVWTHQLTVTARIAETLLLEIRRATIATEALVDVLHHNGTLEGDDIERLVVGREHAKARVAVDAVFDPQVLALKQLVTQTEAWLAEVRQQVGGG